MTLRRPFAGGRWRSRSSPTETACAASPTCDYDCRADALDAPSPYLYHMFYGRRQQPKSNTMRSRKHAKKRRRTGLHLMPGCREGAGG